MNGTDKIPSKFVVPGDELWVYDAEGNVIQEPKPETPEELAKREPARLRSEAAMEGKRRTRDADDGAWSE